MWAIDRYDAWEGESIDDDSGDNDDEDEANVGDGCEFECEEEVEIAACVGEACEGRN